MNTKEKNRKKLIIAIIVIVIISALTLGLWLFIQYQNDQKTVEVIPVSMLATDYWGDTNQSDGTVVSDYVQEIYPSTDKVISEIFVVAGQEVKIGDPLLQYDKTRLELDLEAKEIAVKEVDIEIDTAQDQLKKLQKTTPAATARPTARPTSRPTAKPTARPTAKPTASPTPTPVPPADVTLYSRLDLDSLPFAGSGTTDDPYRFLCTENCIITSEFLKHMLGMSDDTAATPTPSMEPTPTPVPPDEGQTGDIVEFPDEDAPATPTPEPTPTPTPQPEPGSNLASPFAAVFEVRDGDSNYGQLISAIKLDGTQLSGNIQISGLADGSNTLDSIAALLGATPTPSPTANPNNYNSMGYTSAELKQLIADKKAEIKDAQYRLKQAKLELEKAELKLKNSTILSNMDGQVRTLIDLEEALANNQPFLVVSGDEKYFVAGTISETLLGSINVGDMINVMSYQNGMNYTAQIVSIADYPVDSSSGYYSGAGNPNSSRYEFTAVIEGDGEGLQNGMYVGITMDVMAENSGETYYLDKAYIRDDDAGSYVMKAGIDNRLIKQYVKTGKSIYSGSYMEIVSGLTKEDFIAFPYGTDVKEGVRVKLQGTDDEPIASGVTSITEESDQLSSPSTGEDEEVSSSSQIQDYGLPEDAVIVGADGDGIHFKTENGGGVILD